MALDLLKGFEIVKWGDTWRVQPRDTLGRWTAGMDIGGGLFASPEGQVLHLAGLWTAEVGQKVTLNGHKYVLSGKPTLESPAIVHAAPGEPPPHHSVYPNAGLVDAEHPQSTLDEFEAKHAEHVPPVGEQIDEEPLLHEEDLNEEIKLTPLAPTKDSPQIKPNPPGKMAASTYQDLKTAHENMHSMGLPVHSVSVWMDSKQATAAEAVAYSMYNDLPVMDKFHSKEDMAAAKQILGQDVPSPKKSPIEGVSPEAYAALSAAHLELAGYHSKPGEYDSESLNIWANGKATPKEAALYAHANGVEVYYDHQEHIPGFTPRVPEKTSIPVDDGWPKTSPEQAQEFGFTDESKFSKIGQYNYYGSGTGVDKTKEVYKQSMTKAWSDAEQVAVVGYTGSDYSYINKMWKMLRTGSLGEYEYVSAESVKKMIKNMDGAFSKVSLSEPLEVYRSIGSEAFHKHVLPHLEVGKSVVIDAGFISTTTNSDMSFNGSNNIKILLPKGAKAIPVAPISEHPGESEVLINRGSRFIVRAFSANQVVLEYIHD